MSASITPSALSNPRRGLRARLGRARRRAAVVTSAALIAAGGGVTASSVMVDAEPVAVAEAAPPPATLLPPPMLAVSDVRVDELANTALEAEGEAIPGGAASYYGRELAGNPTANGERFDPSDLTAAHRTLPFGTRVRVTHTETGESVVVRINDRGPFHDDRVIDVSRAAADEIGLTRSGTADVELERLPKTGTRG